MRCQQWYPMKTRGGELSGSTLRSVVLNRARGRGCFRNNTWDFVGKMIYFVSFDELWEYCDRVFMRHCELKEVEALVCPAKPARSSTFFFSCRTTLAFCEVIQWVREQTAGSYYGSAACNPNLVFDSIMLRRDWTVILLHDRAAEMKRCECERRGWRAKGCRRVRRGDKWRSRPGERERGRKDEWRHREEKKEIKMCRGGEAEVGRRRRIKWRGAYDGLAGLQRLPAAIQLLLKATSKKSLLTVPTIQGGRQRRLGTGGRTGESERWKTERGKMKYAKIENTVQEETLSQDMAGCRGPSRPGGRRHKGTKTEMWTSHLMLLTQEHRK